MKVENKVKQTKDKVIRFRVTEEEKKEIEFYSKLHQFKNVSDFNMSAIYHYINYLNEVKEDA